MASKLPNVPRVEYPTPPTILDTILIERSSNKPGNYRPLEPGAPFKKGTHSVEEATLYEGHEFLQQKATEDDEWMVQLWGKPPSTQDVANWDESFSGDANAYPIFARRYLEKRDGYAPRTKATVLPGLYRVQLSNSGSGYNVAPTISFTGGTGSGATAIAVLANDGSIARIVLKAEGSYTVAPAVTITPIDGGSGAVATAVIQPSGAVLVAEKTGDAPAPYDSLYVQVLRVYETLPGPWLYDTRDDLLLGPIQRRRRAILASTIPTTLPAPTATSKTTYEAREQSSIVAWEIVETTSDGTGSAGNPAFPVLPSRPYEPRARGSITRTEQIVIAAGQVGGPPTESGGVVTLITYEEVDEFHMKKVTETFVLAAAPVITDITYDPESRALIIKSRVLKLQSAIVEDITLNTGTDDTVTVVNSEGYDKLVAFEVSTTWIEPAARAEGTQIDTLDPVKLIPWSFPQIMFDFTQYLATNGEMGLAPSFVTKVQVISRAFWTFGSRPNLTLDGIVQLASLDNFFGAAIGGNVTNVIIDAASFGGGTITITASNPDATTYLASFIGSEKAVDGAVDSINRYVHKTTRRYLTYVKQATPVYTP